MRRNYFTKRSTKTDSALQLNSLQLKLFYFTRVGNSTKQYLIKGVGTILFYLVFPLLSWRFDEGRWGAPLPMWWVAAVRPRAVGTLT